MAGNARKDVHSHGLRLLHLGHRSRPPAAEHHAGQCREGGLWGAPARGCTDISQEVLLLETGEQLPAENNGNWENLHNDL